MKPEDYVARWPDVETRIHAHAKALLDNHVVAICADRQRPRVVGSGFLVQSSSALYLVSAAHVFEEQRLYGADDGLFFYVNDGTLGQALGGTICHSKDPTVDTAILQLEASGLAWKDVSAPKPVRLEDLGDLSKAMPDDWFFLGGFPESKSRIDSLANKLVGHPYAMLKQQAPPEAYADHELTTGRHVLLEFNQKATVDFVGGSSARFPDPKGISGAPLWLVEFLGNGELASRVVGIAIEHRRKSRHKVIVCTRIESIIDMIDHLERNGDAAGAV
jgi:hypothetical protein